MPNEKTTVKKNLGFRVQGSGFRSLGFKGLRGLGLGV